MEFHVEDHPDPLDVELLEAHIRSEASRAKGLGDEVELAIFVPRRRHDRRRHQRVDLGRLLRAAEPLGRAAPPRPRAGNSADRRRRGRSGARGMLTDRPLHLRLPGSGALRAKRLRARRSSPGLSIGKRRALVPQAPRIPRRRRRHPTRHRVLTSGPSRKRESRSPGALNGPTPTGYGRAHPVGGACDDPVAFAVARRGRGRRRDARCSRRRSSRIRRGAEDDHGAGDDVAHDNGVCSDHDLARSDLVDVGRSHVGTIRNDNDPRWRSLTNRPEITPCWCSGNADCATCTEASSIGRHRVR